MATESPPSGALDLITHTLEDLTQQTDEPEDKFLEDVRHRIDLLQKDLPSHQIGESGSDVDNFWAAVQLFQESGEHKEPQRYIHSKGFKQLVGSLREIQKIMFAKRDAISAPIDPEQTISGVSREDPLRKLLIEKGVFLPHRERQARDQYSEELINYAFKEVTESDLRDIAFAADIEVDIDDPREVIVRRITDKLNSQPELVHRFQQAVPDSAPPRPKPEIEETIQPPKQPVVDLRTGVGPTARSPETLLLMPPPKKGAREGEQGTQLRLTQSDRQQMRAIRRKAGQLVNNDYRNAETAFQARHEQRPNNPKDVLGFQYLQDAIKHRYEIEKEIFSVMTKGQDDSQRADTIHRLRHNREFRDMQNDITSIYINRIALEISDAEQAKIRLEPTPLHSRGDLYMNKLGSLPDKFPYLRSVHQTHKTRGASKGPWNSSGPAESFVDDVLEIGGLLQEHTRQISGTSDYENHLLSQLEQEYNQFVQTHPNVSTLYKQIFQTDPVNTPALRFLNKYLGKEVKPMSAIMSSLLQSPDPNKLHDEAVMEQIELATPLVTPAKKIVRSPFERPSDEEQKELQRYSDEDAEMRRDPEATDMDIMEHWEAAAGEMQERFGKPFQQYRRYPKNLPMSWLEYEQRDAARGFRSPPPQRREQLSAVSLLRKSKEGDSETKRQNRAALLARLSDMGPVEYKDFFENHQEALAELHIKQSGPFEQTVSPSPEPHKRVPETPPTPFRSKLHRQLTPREMAYTFTNVDQYLAKGGTREGWIHKVQNRFHRSDIQPSVVEMFAGIAFDKALRALPESQKVLLQAKWAIQVPGFTDTLASYGAAPITTPATVLHIKGRRSPFEGTPEPPPRPPPSAEAYMRLQGGERREAFFLYFNQPDSINRDQDWLLQAATQYWDSRRLPGYRNFRLDDTVRPGEKAVIEEMHISHKVDSGASYRDLNQNERRIVRGIYERGGEPRSKFEQTSRELYQEFLDHGLPVPDLNTGDEKKEEPIPQPPRGRRSRRPVSIHDEDVMRGGFGPDRPRRRQAAPPRRIPVDVRRHYRNSVIANHGYGMYEPAPTMLQRVRLQTQPFQGYVHSRASGRVAPYGRVHLVQAANIAGPTHFMQQIEADANMGRTKVESMKRHGPFGNKGRYRIMAKSAHVTYTKRAGVIEITIRRGVRPTELDVLIGKLGAHKHSVKESICTIVVNRKKRKLGNLKSVDFNKLRSEIERVLMRHKFFGIMLTDIKGQGALHKKHKAEMHYK